MSPLWHNALGGPKTLHTAENPRSVVQTSQWQWKASVFTNLQYTGSSCSLFTEDCCPVLSR